MKRMVIKGSEWHRGSGDAGKLLDPDSGRRCCIGIHAKMCEVPDSILAHETVPSGVCQRRSTVPDGWREPWTEGSPGGVCTNTPVAVKAMGINDDSSLSDDERIEWLRPLFRELGVIIVWRPDL